MKRQSLLSLISGLTLFIFALSPVASADDAALMTMVKDLQKQMGEMQKTMNWQKDKIKSLESRKPEVKYVSQGSGAYESDGAFKANLEDYIGDSHKWLKDLKFYGDFRLRYEGLHESGAAAANDRNRFRYRLRFGFKKNFDGIFDGDKMEVGFRLASGGNGGGRTSTNQTLDGNFDFDGLAIDRAYAKYMPEALNVGPISKSTITAGKFKNPFKYGSSWVMWDGDVTPEGLAQSFDLNLIKDDDLELKGKLQFGQLILDEGDATGNANSDAEMLVYQAGVNSKIKLEDAQFKTKHVFTFYQTHDYASNADNFTAGNNTLSSDGDSLTAGDFKILNFYNEIGTEVIGKPFKIYYDFYHNLDGEAPGISDQDNAWMLGLKLGKAKKKGSWELKYEYARIEANSVLGGFTDSDFGGTDRRGSVIKAAYALTDNLKLKFAAFYTNRLTAADTERDLYQADLVWKF